jgi:hypothetical protein
MVAKKRTRGTNGGRGIGVDYQGGPVVDPTENVISLNEAANKRQDDLREANDKYMSARIMHVEEMARLRAEHGKAISELESNRLNAIRQVDQLAVSTAADRAQDAIQTLAATTAANADNVRTALSATAATIATQLTNTVAAITERLAALERSSYEGVGKQKVADPQMERLSALVELLARNQATGAGKSEGTQWAIGVGIAAAGVLIAFAMMAAKLL